MLVRQSIQYKGVHIEIAKFETCSVTHFSRSDKVIELDVSSVQRLDVFVVDAFDGQVNLLEVSLFHPIEQLLRLRQESCVQALWRIQPEREFVAHDVLKDG